jgi:hypothetical protein
MKRFFILAMAIFSLSFLFGFAPQPLKSTDDFIILSLDTSSNGRTTQGVYFSINSKRINNISSSIKEEINFKNNLKNQVEVIRSEFLFSFALAYLQNPIEEYKINQGVVLPPVAVNNDLDMIGFQIIFTSHSAWNYYHQTKGGQTAKNKRNIFLNKIASEELYPFSAEVKVGESQTITAGERYKQMYLSSAVGLSFEKTIMAEYNPTFVYDYSSFNKKLRSNANAKFADNNRHYHHVWAETDCQNAEKICLYYYNINKGVWIAFATALPLLGMGVAIAVIKHKENKLKKKG